MQLHRDAEIAAAEATNRDVVRAARGDPPLFITFHAVSDAWLVAIVGGAAATVIGGLLIEPVRRFIGAAGRVVLGALAAVVRASVPGWTLLVVVAAVAFLARTTPVPIWVLVAAAAAVALVAAWMGRRAPPPMMEVYDPATGTVGPARVEAAPAGPPSLNTLQSEIVQLLAAADGAPLRIFELVDATNTRRLRVEQAVEHLERVGLIERLRSYVDGTAYGLTPLGRDFAIARGYV